MILMQRRNRTGPLMPMGKICCENRLTHANRFSPGSLQIAIDHDGNQVLKAHLRCPIELTPCFSRVSTKMGHLVGAEVAWKNATTGAVTGKPDKRLRLNLNNSFG
jgi:hypothetical protein